VEVDPAGGGAAAAAERRLGVKLCTGGRGAEQSTCLRKKKRGRGPGDLFGNSKNFRDLSVKKDFPLM
jgi:hypothetical protein